MTVWSFLWNCFWILHKHMVAKYGLVFVSGKEISHVECQFCLVSWTSYVILFLLMLSGHCSYTRAKALWHWSKPRHTYIPYTHIHLFKRSLRYIFPIHLVGCCLCLNSLQTKSGNMHMYYTSIQITSWNPFYIWSPIFPSEQNSGLNIVNGGSSCTNIGILL